MEERKLEKLEKVAKRAAIALKEVASAKKVAQDAAKIKQSRLNEKKKIEEQLRKFGTFF